MDAGIWGRGEKTGTDKTDREKGRRGDTERRQGQRRWTRGEDKDR